MSLPASAPTSVPLKADRPSPSADPPRPVLLGAGVVLVGAAMITAFAANFRLDVGRAGALRMVLGTGTALCAFAVFALSRATWRQTGTPAALWAGCGVLVVGIAAASEPDLVRAVFGDRGPAGDRWAAAVAAAGLIVAPLLFGAGLLSAVQRLRVGAASLTAGAVLAVVAVSVLVHAAPRLGTALSVSQLSRGEGAGSVAGGTAVIGIWLAVAVAYSAQALRRRWLSTWVGPLLFALILSGLADGAARTTNGWAVGAALLGALGLLVAVVGSHLELTRAYEGQTMELSDSALEAETAEVRERVRAAGLRARRHDLVNAIMAVEGAAAILEREFERLSETDRETLAGVVRSGTARLRGLLALEGGGETRVSLAATAADVANDPSWGVPFELDVRPDLLAAGSPGETAEAVRQLVDGARRRSPAGLVTLRGERDGDWVVLRVEDRGPTMPRQLRRTVTDPDSRREPAREDDMGVRLAGRLMRGQGGDLWVEARPGGGTSFGICLPARAGGHGDAGATGA